MPRRNRRDLLTGGTGGGSIRPPEDISEMAERIIGQTSVRAEGFETRTVSGPKRYRCPHCEGWIEPFVQHVVAFQSGEPEDRRHYHRGCWIKRTAALKKKTK